MMHLNLLSVLRRVAFRRLTPVMQRVRATRDPTSIRFRAKFKSLFDWSHPYAWRTWLRMKLPLSLINRGLIPKGTNCLDAGGYHWWYDVNQQVSACTHCAVTRPGVVPARQAIVEIMQSLHKGMPRAEVEKIVDQRQHSFFEKFERPRRVIYWAHARSTGSWGVVLEYSTAACLESATVVSEDEPHPEGAPPDVG